ncbi:MAG: hypothetical protein GXP58_10580 [Deltaproteobacteria bacterium]|nr:hypothetical protein [Deltaproteobacteria bacterium]
MFGDLLRVSLAGGVIGLDRLAFGQFMISQPIVAAPLVGWLLGDFHDGMQIGVVLELFWFRGLPVGGHVPKNATLSAILTTGISLSVWGAGPGIDMAWPAWVFLWVGLLLYPIGFLDRWLRRKNARLIHMAKAAPSLGQGVRRSTWAGIGLFFLYYFLLTLLVTGFFSSLLWKAYTALPETLPGGLRLFFFLLPAIGIGSLVVRKDLSRGWMFCTAGGLMAFLLFWILGEVPGFVPAVLMAAALGITFLKGRRKSMMEKRW